MNIRLMIRGITVVGFIKRKNIMMQSIENWQSSIQISN